jgi:hypothetical protein
VGLRWTHILCEKFPAQRGSGTELEVADRGRKVLQMRTGGDYGCRRMTRYSRGVDMRSTFPQISPLNLPLWASGFRWHGLAGRIERWAENCGETGFLPVPPRRAGCPACAPCSGLYGITTPNQWRCPR